MSISQTILILALFASCCDFRIAADGRNLEVRQGIGDGGLSIRYRSDAPAATRQQKTLPEKNDAVERTIRRNRDVKHGSTDDVRRKPIGKSKPEKPGRRKGNKALKKRNALKKRQRHRARKRMKKRKVRKKRKRNKKRRAKKRRRSRKKRESTNKRESSKPREPKPSPSVAIDTSPVPTEPLIPSPVASKKPASPDSSARRQGQEEKQEDGVESETGISLQADIDTKSPLKVQLKPFGASAGDGGQGPRLVCYKVYVLQGTTIRHYRVKFRTAVPDKGQFNIKVVVGGCIVRAYQSQCIKLTSLKKKSCSDEIVKQCLGKNITLFEETSPDDGEKDSSSSKSKPKAKSDLTDPPSASPSASPVAGKTDAE